MYMVKMLGATFIKELRLFDPFHRLLTWSLNTKMLGGRVCVCVCLCVSVCVMARLGYITSGWNLPSAFFCFTMIYLS